MMYDVMILNPSNGTGPQCAVVAGPEGRQTLGIGEQFFEHGPQGFGTIDLHRDTSVADAFLGSAAITDDHWHAHEQCLICGQAVGFQ